MQCRGADKSSKTADALRASAALELMVPCYQQNRQMISKHCVWGSRGSVQVGWAFCHVPLTTNIG